MEPAVGILRIPSSSFVKVLYVLMMYSLIYLNHMIFIVSSFLLDIVEV